MSQLNKHFYVLILKIINLKVFKKNGYGGTGIRVIKTALTFLKMVVYHIESGGWVSYLFCYTKACLLMFNLCLAVTCFGNFY
jgi:hypothetical protein